MADRELHPGNAVGLSLAAGAEIVCTGGLLYVTATGGPWLGGAWTPTRRPLPAGQAWRASEAQWVKLEVAQQAARFRLNHSD
jgi:hypothetical protein